MNRILHLLVFLLTTLIAQGQIVVQVTIDSGMADSECLDGPFEGAIDPLFAVAVEGGAFDYYPEDTGCFTALPNTPYSQNYDCEAMMPATVQICLRVTENDAIFQPPLGCEITETCTENICDDFIIPVLGASANYNLSIAVPGSSSGEVNFTIETTGSAIATVNDFICDAIDFGTVIYGDTIGDMTQGMFNNLCATNTGEPDPQSLGANFTNQNGVWFAFNTGPTPSGLITVEALSDPMNVGEPIDLEVGVFTTDNGACDGNLALIDDFFLTNNGFDSELRIPCPTPNTTYYILVDGSNNLGDYQGVFGLQIWDIGIIEGGDLRCDYLDMGTVVEGGSVSTPEPLANFCATDIQDPFLPTFQSDHSVWFSFIAPPSGHVIIEGTASGNQAPLDVQLALYRSFNNTCTGFFSYVTSQYTSGDPNETMEVTCLYAGREYWILVDGGSPSRGVFELTVSDAGDITPVTDQDVTLCFGESLMVGNIEHTETGIYADTLQVMQGCDSIVNSNLTILDELVVTVTQTQPAIGMDGMNGIAIVEAMGGAGDYTYAWCTGETATMATMLPAGQMCCVVVTDDNDCETEVCFEVEFTIAIIPTFENDSLACFGDTNGMLTVAAENGVPPYDYVWENPSESLSGNGTIDTEGGSFTINNLPAGTYAITINDAFLDTAFTALVVQPDELLIDLVTSTDASCFGVCDGSMMTSVTGGTLPYNYSWSNGETAGDAIMDLCAGNYDLMVTDDQACIANFSNEISQPDEFIATISVVQEVSCFEGDDGIASVDNGNSVAWNWDNAATTQIADNLLAGTYFVTVTNGDGCLDTTSVDIPQPNGPLEVSIEELIAVSCFGFEDGQLRADVTGPFAALEYRWSNLGTAPSIQNLGTGNYDVLVTNEKGCEATATYFLDQPTEVVGETFPIDINCLDGPSAGLITIENVSGGTPGYTFGLEDGLLGATPLVEGLTAGNYDVVVRDASGCVLVLPASILPPPEIAVTLGRDTLIHLGDVFELNAITNTMNGLFSWSHADTLLSGTALIQPKETNIYQVFVRDTLTHCIAEDNVQIHVDVTPRVFAPNIFSPNGDGRNDKFFIFGGNDVVSIETFRIFGRNGQLVYENKDLHPGDFDAGWDGTVGGELMNTGVFVYVAELKFVDGRVDVVKGDVMLMR